MVNARKSNLYIGMMSGTSADGVDAVLVEFSQGAGCELKHTLFVPYSDSMRSRVNELAHQVGDLNQQELKELDADLALFYSNAVTELIRDSNTASHAITAIANHGQTIRHEPNAEPPHSLQLGDPITIAKRTGIRTIAQFRQADLSAGGQGAPLMPAFHEHYLRTEHDRVVVNIGGIANISVISSNQDIATVGFDTGPGNTLMDQWIDRHKGARYDKDGAWAASGKANQKILTTLLADEYFDRLAPKSTGPDYFNLDWLVNKAPAVESLAPAIVQATLLELSSQSIVNAIKANAPNTKELIVCGGGAHNSNLISSLSMRSAELRSGKGASVVISDELGIAGDWMEALGFAWLGYCFDKRIPSNLPSVTGAAKRVVLGKEFLAT